VKFVEDYEKGKRKKEEKQGKEE